MESDYRPNNMTFMSTITDPEWLGIGAAAVATPLLLRSKKTKRLVSMLPFCSAPTKQLSSGMLMRFRSKLWVQPSTVISLAGGSVGYIIFQRGAIKYQDLALKNTFYTEYSEMRTRVIPKAEHTLKAICRSIDKSPSDEEILAEFTCLSNELENDPLVTNDDWRVLVQKATNDLIQQKTLMETSKKDTETALKQLTLPNATAYEKSTTSSSAIVSYVQNTVTTEAPRAVSLIGIHYTINRVASSSFTGKRTGVALVAFHMFSAHAGMQTYLYNVNDLCLKKCEISILEDQKNGITQSLSTVNAKSEINKDTAIQYIQELAFAPLEVAFFRYAYSLEAARAIVQVYFNETGKTEGIRTVEMRTYILQTEEDAMTIFENATEFEKMDLNVLMGSMKEKIRKIAYSLKS